MFTRFTHCALLLTWTAASCIAADRRNTIAAASCRQHAVQQAIDAASDGDTVVVPAGGATWTTGSFREPAVLIDNKSIVYNDLARPGYKPYPYPHPLSRQWPAAAPESRKPPETPKNLAVRRIGDRDVELTWDAPPDNSGATGYYLWLNGSRVTAITDPSCSRYILRRLKAVTESVFAISAFDAAGNESGPSASVRLADANGELQGPSGTEAAFQRPARVALKAQPRQRRFRQYRGRLAE